VPVASVEEDDQAGVLENEIGFAGQIAGTELPAANTGADHAEPDCLFSRPVAARTDCGHVAGALFWCEPVHQR
jgi:hypothetical protein